MHRRDAMHCVSTVGLQKRCVSALWFLDSMKYTGNQSVIKHVIGNAVKQSGIPGLKNKKSKNNTFWGKASFIFPKKYKF